MLSESYQLVFSALMAVVQNYMLCRDMWLVERGTTKVVQLVLDGLRFRTLCFESQTTAAQLFCARLPCLLFSTVVRPRALKRRCVAMLNSSRPRWLLKRSPFRS